MKTKKIFKGMTAAAIAAVLTASMVPMTAFAAEVTTTAQTITFAQNVKNESDESKLTYDIYQVATAEVAKGGTSYDYTLTSDFEHITNPFYVENSTDLQTKDATITIDTIANTLSTNAADMKKLADALSSSVTATKLYSVQAGNSQPLAPGYYLIKTSGSQMTGAPILLSVRSDMEEAKKTVSAKTAEITFDKTINNVTAGANGTGITGGTVGADKDTAQVSIGSTVSYELATSFPDYAETIQAANMTEYSITDIPSDGLTIVDKNDNSDLDKEDLVVKVDGSETTNYTLTKNGNGFTISFDSAYVLANKTKAVVVTYDALVNSKAVVGTAGNPNTATLKFDNNYYEGGSSKDIPDEAKVFTTKLVVNKTFSDNPSSGSYPIAGFTLYAANGTDIIATDSTTADNNTVVFKGLAAGTYILKETTTPDGYKTAAPVTIVITANGDANYDGTYTFTNATMATDNTYGTATIVNIQGQTLPGTGGVGTTIFTIAGVGVVLVAGAMLVVYMRKRRTEDEE